MTIHHDKLAYGKLAKTSEELSEEKIAEMLKKLEEEEEPQNEASQQTNPNPETGKKQNG